MAKYVGSIRPQSALRHTAADLAEYGNQIFTAMTSVGMLRVPSEDFPNQSGTLVTSSTGASDETVIDGAVSNGNKQVKAFNVYRHPTLGIFIKVSIIVATYSGSITSIFEEYEIGRDIAEGKFFGATSIIGNCLSDTWVTTWANISAPFINYFNYAPLYAYCDDNSFWICSGGVYATRSIVGNQILPYGLAPTTCLGLFKQVDDNKIALISLSSVVAPETNRTVLGIQGVANADVSGGYASNPRVRLLVGGGVEDLGTNAVAYSPISAAKQSIVNNSYRVIRFSLIQPSNRCYFGFALLPISGISQFSTIDLDLHGAGVKTYIAVPHMGNFGPAINLTNGNTITDAQHWIAAFPWE